MLFWPRKFDIAVDLAIDRAMKRLRPVQAKGADTIAEGTLDEMIVGIWTVKVAVLAIEVQCRVC